MAETKPDPFLLQSHVGSEAHQESNRGHRCLEETEGRSSPSGAVCLGSWIVVA